MTLLRKKKKSRRRTPVSAVCGNVLICVYDFFVDDVSFFIAETKKNPKIEPEKSIMISLT